MRKGELAPEEPVPGKGAAGSKGPLPGDNSSTQRLERVLTKQQRIAEVARERRQESLTSLNHYLDEEWLAEAVERVRAQSAPGTDGQTLNDYRQGLESRLKDLLRRAKSGDYQAPPVKRVYIPKDEKETRPIGMPTIEDKILQRAVVMLLEPIYEGDFKDFSYGFRPERSAHQALESMWRQIMNQNTGWILDVDIRKFFRHAGPFPPAPNSRAQGKGWSHPSVDRQMAQRWNHGGRPNSLSRGRHSAGRSGQSTPE